jgi:hypothetical protein
VPINSFESLINNLNFTAMKTTAKTILAVCIVSMTLTACNEQPFTVLPQKTISVAPEPIEPLLPSNEIIKPRLNVPVSDVPATKGKSVMIVNPKPTIEIPALAVERLKAEVPRDN